MTASVKTARWALAGWLLGALAAQAAGPTGERRDISTTPEAVTPAPSATPGAAMRTSDAPSWQKRVVAELQRRKRYPATLAVAASQAGEEPPPGKVTLSFALDRAGKVVAASIAASSGRPEFDAAALAMTPLGAAFPPPPPTMMDERTSLTVPVSFIGVRQTGKPAIR